ncbi:ABC transporter substrate-binding protein [Mycobacterium sp. ITM-2016-00317]|uniref:ABC transporter substrate-binding protein n=1 Tax=Mycobacterium sp. ITM-2016-00317 TaxID=2099694 RepID=UPI00287FAEC7|nr:ABC transporter substrate-binding protein [Mycobacterium sp. ITM-2016-00317]WNG88547.1 ABC transporter substrate-binding protein [Mycobacterium sp. ITM-2016-00317]
MRSVAALLILFFSCVACARDDGPAPAPATAGTEPGRTVYPLTLDNCGVQVTFDGPPQRAVSLYQASTEILLSLGLAERMVGTSTWFDPVLPQLAAGNAKVPRLADNDPSLETVLDADPDLVTSASAHTFTPAVVAERSRFAELGIPTYQSPSVCVGAEVNGEQVTRTEPLRIDTLFQEITELAQIFDVQQRGADLVAELQQRLDTVLQEDSDGPQPTVAFWFSGVKTPYMAGCCSAPGMYAEIVDAANVFADAREDWPEVSWEAVADRDPDVLVLADLSRQRIEGDSLATKKEFLQSNPVTRSMTAVREQRYVVLTGSELDPGIREVDAVEKLAAGLDQRR